MSIRRDVRHIRHELGRLIALVELNAPWEQIMAAIDDLTASIGALETTATAVEAEVNALKSGSDEAALAALNTRVQTINAGLAALVPAPAPEQPA